MDKITGVLDALQNIFGKGFLLAGFLPIVTLLTVSWILGCALSPACRELSEYLLQAKVTQQLAISMLLLLLLSIASFVFWLLNPTFRQFLEGRLLPRWLQDWLAAGHRRKLNALNVEILELRTQTGNYRQARETWPADFNAVPIQAGTTMQDTALGKEYDSLRRALDSLQPVAYERVEKFRERLLKELGTTSPITVPLLGEMRDELVNRFIPMGIESIERAYYRHLTDRTFRYPERPMSVGPTTLANIQEAQRDYLSRNYGIDISVFWSDLQKIATGDEKFAAVLENSKTRYDFSVAVTVVSAIFTLCWMLLHVYFGSSLFGPNLVVYSVVSLLGIGTTVIFHRLVLISYQAFAETVKTTVELFRFELMKALHFELPRTTTDEQQAWLELALRLQSGTPVPINYKHA